MQQSPGHTSMMITSWSGSYESSAHGSEARCWAAPSRAAAPSGSSRPKGSASGSSTCAAEGSEGSERTWHIHSMLWRPVQHARSLAAGRIKDTAVSSLGGDAPPPANARPRWRPGPIQFRRPGPHPTAGPERGAPRRAAVVQQSEGGVGMGSGRRGEGDDQGERHARGVELLIEKRLVCGAVRTSPGARPLRRRRRSADTSHPRSCSRLT